jgi:hypothetical protein
MVQQTVNSALRLQIIKRAVSSPDDFERTIFEDFDAPPTKLATTIKGTLDRLEKMIKHFSVRPVQNKLKAMINAQEQRARMRHPNLRGRIYADRHMVTFDPEATDRINKWAQANGVSFSAATECLALLAIDAPSVKVFSPIIVSVIRNMILAETKILIRMLKRTTVHLGTANQVAGTLNFMAIQDYAEIRGERFRPKAVLESVADSPLGERVEGAFKRAATRGRIAGMNDSRTIIPALMADEPHSAAN